MEENTKQRKKAINGMKEVYGRQGIVEQMYRIIVTGKEGLDTMMKEMGRMVAEAIMYIEREEIAGPEYRLFSSEIKKWATRSEDWFLGEESVRSFWGR